LVKIKERNLKKNRVKINFHHPANKAGQGLEGCFSENVLCFAKPLQARLNLA
jgi:hypothetical protein